MVCGTVKNGCELKKISLLGLFFFQHVFKENVRGGDSTQVGHCRLERQQLQLEPVIAEPHLGAAVGGSCQRAEA